MGLFDMFKADTGATMTPHLGFSALMFAIMASDGEIDPEEVGQLLSVIGGKDNGSGTIVVGQQAQQLLDAAQKLVKTVGVDGILSQLAQMPTPLTDAQKMCILVNMLDSSLSDGQPEQQEQAIFAKTMAAFGITEARFRPFFEVLVLKGDRSVFINQAHPKNAPGYQVKLPV